MLVSAGRNIKAIVAEQIVGGQIIFLNAGCHWNANSITMLEFGPYTAGEGAGFPAFSWPTTQFVC